MRKLPRSYEDALARASVLAPLAAILPLKAVCSILGAAVLLVGGYYFSLYAIHGFDRDFLAINKCVESGGRWNHQLRICETLPGIYEPPSPVNPY
jgi:hypothetical protein